MPVINATPQKTLASCEAEVAALFTVSQSGCSLFITNASTATGVTNIEYRFSVGGSVIETVNTTDSVYEWVPGSMFSSETISIRQTITAAEGVFVFERSVPMPLFFDSCYVQLWSNMGPGDTMDPQMTGVVSYWRWPNNELQALANPTRTGSDIGFDGNPQAFRFRPISGDFADYTRFNFIGDGILGIVDLSKFTEIVEVRMESNPGMTGLVGLASSQRLNVFRLDSGITGTLDLSGQAAGFNEIILRNTSGMSTVLLPTTAAPCGGISMYSNTGLVNFDMSGLSNFSGNLELNGCTNLTNFVPPSGGGPITNCELHATSISGVLDFSGVTVEGTFYCYGVAVTDIIFKPHAGVFAQFRVYSCNIGGVWDLSMLIGLGGAILIHNNPLLTNVNFPVTTVPCSLSIYSCSISGNFDMSNLKNLGNNIDVGQNPGITSLTFPVTPEPTGLDYEGCSLSGIVDLSNLQQLGRNMWIRSSTATGIIFPSASIEPVSLLQMGGASYAGTIDLSGMGGLGGNLILSGTNATSFVFPSSTTHTTTSLSLHLNGGIGYTDITGLTFSTSAAISLYSCDWSAAIVNRVLSDLDAMLGAGTGTITIDGTNAAPDSSSGGFDGTSAKANLTSKGWNPITN
jgi:hypothetical protein